MVKTVSNLLLVSKPHLFILFFSCFILTYIYVQHQDKILLTPVVNKEKGLSTLRCKNFSFFPLRLKYHSNRRCQLLLKQAVYRPLFPRLSVLAFFASKMMGTVQLSKNLPPTLLLNSYDQKTLFLSSASVPLFLRYFPMDWRVCE